MHSRKEANTILSSSLNNRLGVLVIVVRMILCLYFGSLLKLSREKEETLCDRRVTYVCMYV